VSESRHSLDTRDDKNPGREGKFFAYAALCSLQKVALDASEELIGKRFASQIDVRESDVRGEKGDVTDAHRRDAV
jgi:hypothetical protein